MPSKRDVMRVRIWRNQYDEVAKQFLECTLTEAYSKFKDEQPEVKVGQRSFEKRKPQQVISAKVTDRLVCGCIYHYRMHYLLLAINDALKLLHSDARFASLSDLVDYTLCPAGPDGKANIECIERRCALCG